MGTPKSQMEQALADLVQRSIGTPAKPPAPPAHKIEVTDEKIQVHGGAPSNFKSQINGMLEQALDGALDGAARRMGHRWSQRRIQRSIRCGAFAMAALVWMLNFAAAGGKLSASDFLQMTVVIGALGLLAALVASAFVSPP